MGTSVEEERCSDPWHPCDVPWVGCTAVLCATFETVPLMACPDVPLRDCTAVLCAICGRSNVPWESCTAVLCAGCDLLSVLLERCVAVPNLSCAGLFATGFVAASLAERTGDLIGDLKTTLLVGDSLLDLIVGRGVGDLGRFGERRLDVDRSLLAGCLAGAAGRRGVKDRALGERALDVEALGAGEVAVGLDGRTRVDVPGEDGVAEPEE